MSDSHERPRAVPGGRSEATPPLFALGAAALLTLCLLLYLKPYYGIRHDSVLYLGQALLHSKPEQFSQDLFFAYGSQANFTIFPTLASTLLQHFTAGDVFLAISLVGRLCFLAASAFLVMRLMPHGYGFWALLALLVMPSGYGGYNVYSYGEAFATSRIFAEPLVLLSLGAVLRGQWAPGAVAWLLAVALHPLMALTSVLPTWLILLGRDRRWLHLIWLPAGVLALGLAGVELPFDALARYDGQWLKWILVANLPVFVFQWRLADWCYLLTDAFLVYLVASGASGDLRRLARVLLVAVPLAIALSVALSDLLHFVLPTGLQFWRAHWLLRWLAMASLPWLLWQQWAAGPRDRPRLLLLVAIAAIAARQLPNPSAVLILIPLFLAWPRIRDRIRPQLGRLLGIAVVVGLAIIYVKLTVVAGLDVHRGVSRELLRPEYMLLSQAPVMGGLVVLGLLGWRSARTAGRVALACVLAGWLAYAALEWDRRSPAMRDIEAAQAGSLPFGVALEPGAQLLWMKEVHFEEALATWLAIGRPSYFTMTQKAGLLFNRRTAAEAMARQAVVSPLEGLDDTCSALIAAGQPADSCLRDYREALGRACRSSGGRLRYVVLKHDLGGDALGTWQVSLEHQGDRKIRNYLYRCSELAHDVGAAAGATFPFHFALRKALLFVHGSGPQP